MNPDCVILPVSSVIILLQVFRFCPGTAAVLPEHGAVEGIVMLAEGQPLGNVDSCIPERRETVIGVRGRFFPGVFCGREDLGYTDEWLRAVVEFDILPTLGEYWFDEPDKVTKWENNLRGVFDD